MAIELAMVRFIGSGVSTWATGLELTLPDGAISDGARLIFNLSSAQREKTAELMSGLKSRILANIHETDVSMEDVELCLSALPELLDSVRLDPDLLHSAVVQAEVERFSDGDVSDIARHLTSELVLLTRNSSYSQDPILQSPLAFVLMEWLFESLLLHHDAIADLKPAIAQILASYDEDRDALADDIEHDAPVVETSSDTSTPDVYVGDCEGGTSDGYDPDDAAEILVECSTLVARLGQDTGLTEKTIISLIQVGDYDRRRLSAHPTALKAHAETCRTFIDQLHVIGADMGLDLALSDVLETGAKEMSCGNFPQVGKLLKTAELMAASKLPRSKDCEEERTLEQTFAYLALKTLRAKYFEIVRSWRDAAILYQAASRLLPDSARYERWRLMTKCAEALGKFGETQNNIDTLIEATHVYAEAGGLLTEQDNPHEWASVHLDIGRVLMLLGKREGQPARFLAAALHFKPAGDVLQKQASHQAWAKAQLLLAQALKAQGDVQGDVVTLEDAITCYRNALRLLKRDSDPDAWAEAQVGLGATLQRISDETENQTMLPAAMEALENVLQFSTVFCRSVVADAEAAMARAKIQLAVETSDVRQLQSAIGLLNNARDAMAREASTSDLAELECHLGLAIWSLAQAQGQDETDLELAVKAFESAAMRYDAQGDELNADAMRERIAELSDVLAA